MPVRIPMPPVMPAKPSKEPRLDGMRVNFASIDEMHEMKPAPLITLAKPNTTVVHLFSKPDGTHVNIRMDGIDAFCTALRRITAAAAEAAAALGAMARAVIDADLINRYGTAKEIHYIAHGRKARTRKKYRNRVLRRARRTERRNARENRTPRA